MLFPNIFSRNTHLRHLNLFCCSSSKIFLRDKSHNVGRSCTKTRTMGEGNWEEISIPVPWGHIAGKAWGNKNGLPVLGIHGWLDNAGSFDTLAPLLLDSLYFVTVDLPGHGFSSHLPPGISYSYIEYLLTIRRIIRHLKWEKYSLIGHSLGAGMSSLYSGIYPKEVERLVMLDLKKLITNPTDATYPEHFRNSFQIFLGLEDKNIKSRNDVPLYNYKEMVTRLVRAENKLTEESAKILLIRGASQVQNLDKWKLNRDLCAINFDTLIFTHESLFQIQGQIRCPVLVLVAKEGFERESEELLAKCVKIYEESSSNFKMFETGLGHCFFLNDPVEPAKLINAFFQE